MESEAKQSPQSPRIEDIFLGVWGNQNSWICNWAGSCWEQTPPHILCFPSSLKYLDKNMWCTFTKLFYKCWASLVAQVVKNSPGKIPTEGKKLTHPSRLWRDPANICNNLLFFFTSPYRQPTRELCTSGSHTPGLPSLAFPLKMLYWKLPGSLNFLSISCSGRHVWCLMVNTAPSFTTARCQ